MMESINLVLSYVVAAVMVVSAVITLGATAPVAVMAVANAALQTVSFVGSMVYQASGYTNETAMQVTKWANYVGTPLSIIDIALSGRGQTKPKTSRVDTGANHGDITIPRAKPPGNFDSNMRNPAYIRRGSAGR